ncbi:Vitamin B12-dependent ribonucleoside-diphosphate reductase [uncultured archaeon]|nr:Vitamin B12-dependent ribonucleoside-diphosphate reductase [uncultured archaeon]
MPLPKFIKKRDGKIAKFDVSKIRGAISKAAYNLHLDDTEQAVEKVFSQTVNRLQGYNGRIPEINEIEEHIFEASKQAELSSIGNSYIDYRDKRRETERLLEIEGSTNGSSTTDTALLIESDSHDSLMPWDRKRIALQLEEEAELEHDLATDISKRVANIVTDFYKRGVRRLKTTDIRNIVDLQLRQEGLEDQLRKQAPLSIPKTDLEALIFSKSKENSNVASNNPEAFNLGIAEVIQKRWALDNVFSKEVADAHLNGELHLHDLGYITRVYCSSHSVEYLKKYGLNKVLANLEAKSDPPNSAAVLNQHMQTFLASLQAHYAGALGFGFLNILYAPLLQRPVDVVYGKLNGVEMNMEKRDLDKLLEQGVFSAEEGKDNYFEKVNQRKELREVSQKEYDQTAQNLIFAASQNAFSRGGQTLFIDFNVHTGVPKYLKNVPAIGPGGKYMVKMKDGTIEMTRDIPRLQTEDIADTRNGDADDSRLEGKLSGGHIVVYGDLESSAQRFAKSMIEVWRNGDKDGRPFHFPKCDLHVDKDSFSDSKQLEVLDLATKLAAENGCTYFMFDRGDGAVLAQCCRLKERIEDPSMLKYPERLRFTGFQNVTINLPQAAYKGKTLEGTLDEIGKSMELALKAHEQKAEFIQKLLETDGSPMRSLGKSSDDGTPYVDLKKSTYIIGNNGLNEAVQAITGKQLHESEDAFRTGVKIAGYMYKKALEFKERTGLKFVIEETPAESTTRRFAMIDKKKYAMAKKVVKGTEENAYYTNSIHFSPDSDVGIIDRIVGQSKFHDPFIQAGAIVHAYVGEQRPDKNTIRDVVKRTLENTRCSQLVFSPTYTECDSCGTVMPGEKELCIGPECKNSHENTLEKETLNVVTKIVGYNSRVKNWNGSQKQIFEDRKKAEAEYAGNAGRDMSWLYNPNGHAGLTVIQFAKHGCMPCKNTLENIEKILAEQGNNGVEFKIHYLDSPDLKGLEEAAMYDVPFDAFPTVVVAGKDNYWKKTASYAPKSCDNGCSVKEKPKNDLIRPTEIRDAIKARLGDYD